MGKKRPAEADQIPNPSIYEQIPYDSSIAGYVAPVAGFYFMRTKSAANTTITVSIKRNGTEYNVGTVQQPNNIEVFAPLLYFWCEIGDIVKCTAAYSYTLFRLRNEVSE